MAARRGFSNVANQIALVGTLNNTDTSNVITVSPAPSGWPAAYPYYAVIDMNTASEEVVLVTAGSGTSLTITRANNLGSTYGSSTQAHSNGATIQHAATAADYDEANNHQSASSGAHGVTGPLAGTTATQTLTNKTLTAPIITNPTVNGVALSGAVVDTTSSQTVSNKTLNGPSFSGTPTVPTDYFPQAGVSGLPAALAAKADDSAAMHLAGNETVTGIKTYASMPLLPDNGLVGSKLSPAVPRGAQANTTVVSPVTGITTPQDTGATLTYTFLTNRWYKVTFSGLGCFSTNAGDSYAITLVVDGIVQFTVRGVCSSTTAATQSFSGVIPIFASTGASNAGLVNIGSKVVKLQVSRHLGTGTLTLSASGTAPTSLLIEDIGGV